MKGYRSTWRTRLQYVAVAVCASATVAVAEEPDEFLPADTGTLVQINDLALWRQSLVNDPVVRQMLKRMPHHKHQQAWASIQQTMEMSGEQIIDRYFGARLVLVSATPGWRQPATLTLRVTPADTKLLIERLSLQPIGQAKTVRILATPDGSTQFAMHRQWVSIAKAAHVDLLRRTSISRPGRTLSQDPQYRRWVDRLPVKRSALAFFRGPDGRDSSAAAIVDNGNTLSVHFVGRPPGIDRFFRKLGTAQSLELGPLPHDTLAVIMLNVYDQNPQKTEFINTFLAPKTYEQDILPKIQAPVVLFLGEVPKDRVETETDAAFPVLGMAIRLRDPAVAEELTVLADNVLRVANLSGGNQKVPPIPVQRDKHGGVAYRKAHAGPRLVAQTGRKELAPLTLTYGRIGNWYVVCTHDWFFRQCIDAQADPQRRLATDEAFAAMPLKDVQNPVVTVTLRGPAAAAHLRTWVRYWQSAARGQASDDFATRAADVADILGGYKSITAQFHKSDDDALVGRLDLVRQ